MAGSTLIEFRGDRVGFEIEVLVMEAEEVEEALEWVWTWCIERIEETDEDVDLRPRRPEERR